MSTRLLSKSRFKLALECPTKLFYAGNQQYADTSADNSFLAALAEGGYQVGALANLLNEPGETIPDGPPLAQVAQTQVLLQREQVTIFEAAFEHQGLFARVDILRKMGDRVELIEVKAKSFDSRELNPFRRGNGWDRDFLPYLQDIAFQRHVAGLARPEFKLACFLVMPDVSRLASVAGLNQLFRAQRVGRSITVSVAPSVSAEVLGDSVLAKINVDQEVADILAGTLDVGAGQPLPFAEAAAFLRDAYVSGRRIGPVPSGACASCQFKTDTPTPQLRSGLHECWAEAFKDQHWSDADFASGTVLDVWRLMNKDDHVRAGTIRLSDVASKIVLKASDEGISRSERQLWQCRGSGWSTDQPGGAAFYVDVKRLAEQMRSWTFPLHFIDFETSRVPIPFARARRPYQTTAFQFSHHVLHADGRVEHRSQFLRAVPGECPNVEFVRALKASLEGGSTVFRWAEHENNVLNELRRDLLADDDLHDRDALVGFIESITSREEWIAEKNGRKKPPKVAGPRNMVDLCKLAELHFFHPATRGSSSLKKVLPALMACSAFLRDTYGKAAYRSCNLGEPIAWWQERDGHVQDPYKLLPPVFDDMTLEDQEAAEALLPDALCEGGAAMVAYALLQRDDLGAPQRRAIENALLRYCELDTLAMVMAVQAWQAWLREAAVPFLPPPLDNEATNAVAVS